MNGPSPLFRDEAVERRRHGEEFQDLLGVTDRFSWALFSALVILLVLVGVWSLGGSLSTRVQGEGILVTPGGLLPAAVDAQGRVIAVAVRVGDEVTEGQPLAEPELPQLAAQLGSLEQEEAWLAASHDALVRAAESSGGRRKLRGGAARAQLAGARTEAKRYVAWLEERQDVDTRLEQRGHLTAEELGGRRADIVEARTALAGLPREEFGVLRGEVAEVIAHPASREAMLGVLHNEALVDDVLARVGEAPVRVRARLTADASTPSGFAWSSGEGPRRALTPATVLRSSVTVREERPIERVIPLLRGLFGVRP